MSWLPRFIMTQPIVLAGTYTVAGLPAAESYPMNFAWVTDDPVNPQLYWSNGTSWKQSAKRQESFSGTTDGSGNFSGTFTPSFSTAPNTQPVIVNGTDLMVFRLTANSVSGFTVNVVQRVKLTVLGIDLLSFNATPVSGQAVKVMVFES